MNIQPDVNALYERIERLENQNRWTRRLGAVAILSVAVLFVSGQAKVSTKKTIEAEEFVLKDANGKTTAELSSSDAGPDLRFLDQNGAVRLSVGVYAGAPNMALFDQDSKQVATFVSDETGSELWFGSGPTEKPLAAIGTNLSMGKDGKPSLASFVRLCDRKGHDRVELEYSPLFNEASLQVSGTNEKETVGMSAGESIAPSLSVNFGRNGVSLTSDKDGPALSIGDDRGFSASIGSISLVTGATGEIHRTSAASLVFFDKAKNVIWKAP